ncbi:MAG: NAD(P)H-dependent oxidoreductase subunit E [Deltaproteobacteria bacterium]|nr:NAD(P)H-dependent oxidoreductase subunit E [Deltaproteobacteria bacterium]
MGVDLSRIRPVLQRHERGDKTALVHALQDLQATYRYLPEEGVREVCAHLGVPLSKAFAVATFYKAFSLEPRGERICRVCLGTTCHIRGAPLLVEELERLLEVRAGGTTKDLSFTLETVNCVGACAMAPVVLVDGKYHDGVVPTDLPGIVGR